MGQYAALIRSSLIFFFNSFIDNATVYYSINSYNKIMLHIDHLTLCFLVTNNYIYAKLILYNAEHRKKIKNDRYSNTHTGCNIYIYIYI